MRETINLKGSEEDYPADEPRSRRGRGRTMLIVLAVIIVLIVGWWFVNGATQWRAVFLTNNQVYFGHFWDVPFAGTITLRSVYYLELSQPGESLDQQNQSQLKLVKL